MKGLNISKIINLIILQDPSWKIINNSQCSHKTKTFKYKDKIFSFSIGKIIFIFRIASILKQKPKTSPNKTAVFVKSIETASLKQLKEK
jgi:CRISPR/Cas system endoribonuclease Cas6 (RAMP superfamily)